MSNHDLDIDRELTSDIDDYDQDDVAELLMLGAEAEVAPDGRERSELSKIVELNTLRRERAVTAPHRSINPLSFDRGLLGNKVEVRGSTAADPILIPVINWPGYDAEVCPVTISAEANFSLAQSSALVDPVLQVRWGTGGAQFLAEIDIGTGVQFTLNASSVYASAFHRTPTFTCFVSASMGFYSTSQAVPAFRSERTSLDAGGNYSFIRPRFATTLYGIERGDPAQQITLRFRNAALITLYQRVLAANTYLTAPIALSSGVSEVNVTDDGGSAVSVEAIWGLSF